MALPLRDPHTTGVTSVPRPTQPRSHRAVRFEERSGRGGRAGSAAQREEKGPEGEAVRDWCGGGGRHRRIYRWLDQQRDRDLAREIRPVVSNLFPMGPGDWRSTTCRHASSPRRPGRAHRRRRDSLETSRGSRSATQPYRPHTSRCRAREDPAGRRSRPRARGVLTNDASCLFSQIEPRRACRRCERRDGRRRARDRPARRVGAPGPGQAASIPPDRPQRGADRPTHA